MPDDLVSATTAFVERLLNLATQDAELRSHLRRLAKAFLQITDEPAVEEPAATTVVDQVEAAIEQLEVVVAKEAAGVVEEHEEQATPAQLPELTLGRSTTTEHPIIDYPTPKVTAVDLNVVEARCRLKAEGARWAASRRRLMLAGASYDTEIDPKDRDIISRAKSLPNCFLWMCHSSGPTPSSLSLYEDVAGCYEAVAESLSLIKQIKDEPETDQVDFEAALDLLAEAQSALRVSISIIDGPTDTDQSDVHHWLRATATETQIFIRNYMRLDNPADPTQWPDMLNRVEDIAQRVQEANRRRRDRKRLLGKVRHKTTLIVNDSSRGESEWDLLISTICELVDGGLPPSNRELRDYLLPVIELVPEKDDLPLDFQRVLLEIDRYLATVPPPESPAVVKPSKEVHEAAELLRSKSLVLIGGDKRQGAYQTIKEALGLKDLIWVETRAHESVESFEPYVARPDVAAVLLAIRWSSHSYGEVKNFCDRYGKPLIRLPGGYNSNQVAVQIMAQASERLKIDAR